MRSFKTLFALILTALALAMASAVNAAPTPMSDWYLDTDGSGAGSPTQIDNHLDLTGETYAHHTYDPENPGHFTFKESSIFKIFSADTHSQLDPFLTAKFSGSGSATMGEALSFDSGLLEVFVGDTHVASFELVSGSVDLETDSVLPNGTLSMIFKATWMEAGYFFDSSMNDLSLLDEFIFGLATTNVLDIDPDKNVPQDLIDDYNEAFEADQQSPLTPDGVNDLYFSGNGQFRLTPGEVPEPGSLALLGISLLGMAGLRRRSK